jgi:hypothetical protein
MGFFDRVKNAYQVLVGAGDTQPLLLESSSPAEDDLADLREKFGEDTVKNVETIFSDENLATMISTKKISQTLLMISL